MGVTCGTGDLKAELWLCKMQPGFLCAQWARGAMLGVDLTGLNGEHLKGSPDGLKSKGFRSGPWVVEGPLGEREGDGLACSD